MSSLKDQLWIAKYSPKTFNDTIMSDAIKKKINAMIKTREIPNLGFFGPSGTGKTTSATVLIESLGVDKQDDFMFINASDVNSIDAVRDIIKPFAMSQSFNTDLPIKFILLDECLSEHEKVRIGSVDDWKAVPLKDLEKNTDYPIVSFNMDTHEMENDIGNIISDKEDTIYEVELENGKIIQLNDKHPFLIIDDNGNVIEKTIADGLSEGDSIVTL